MEETEHCATRALDEEWEERVVDIQNRKCAWKALEQLFTVGALTEVQKRRLPNGGIDIPAQGYMQHKKVLPLYSLYLRNQTGYANNYYVAYCIEPGVELANSGGHNGTAYTVNDMVDGSGALYRINRDQVEAIGIWLFW